MGGWVMNAAWLIFLLVAGLFFEEPKRAPAPPLPRCASPCGRATLTAEHRLLRCEVLFWASGLAASIRAELESTGM